MAIELSYPYISPTVTITLPNPLFENSEQLNIKKIGKRTRGLITKLYRDPIWEEYTTLFFICQACSQTEITDYVNFVETSYGKEIKLIDHENNIWKGVLVPAEITEQLRYCGFVIQFEFQGIQQ